MPTLRWILDTPKFQTPYFSGQSLLLSTTVLNDGRGYYHRKTDVTKSHRSDITTGGGTNSHQSDIATGGGIKSHRSDIAT